MINYNQLINDRGDAGKQMRKTYKDEVARYLDELRMAKVRSGQIKPFDASELKP